MADFRHIVILTGAGLSAESGLSTFRDRDGIWAKYDYREVATPEGFRANPQLVHDFYNQRRRGHNGVVPNAAHRALARLESEHPGEVVVVTQNIDALHEAAGTRNLIHMHGELLKARCARSGRVYERLGDIKLEERCPCCNLAGTLRPHVVWFGEMPLEMGRIFAALGRCDLFIAIGTSGQVHPAAGFVEEARRGGRARTVELNVEETAISPLFHERVTGAATRIVPEYVEKLLSRH